MACQVTPGSTALAYGQCHPKYLKIIRPREALYLSGRRGVHSHAGDRRAVAERHDQHPAKLQESGDLAERTGPIARCNVLPDGRQQDEVEGESERVGPLEPGQRVIDGAQAGSMTCKAAAIPPWKRTVIEERNSYYQVSENADLEQRSEAADAKMVELKQTYSGN